MHSFFLLVKIQILGLFGINKAIHTDAKKAKRTLALGAVGVVVAVLFVAAYSAGIAGGLVQLGLASEVPLVAVLVGAVLGAVAAFLKANGVLFAFKDFDLVMSLPVSVVSVVLSRIASLYAMSVVLGVLAMTPAFCVYAAVAEVSAVGIVCMALAAVLAPMLPLSVAIVLAVLIAAVATRFKHANIVMVVLMLAATLAAVVGSFALSSQGGDLAALATLGAEATASMAVVFPPAAWAAAGIVQGDLLAFAAFVVVSVAAFVVLVAVLVRVFVPVNALLMSSRPNGSFSFAREGEASGRASGVLRTHAPFQALLIKEARLLVATLIYLLNACIGYVLIVVGAGAAAVARLTGVMPLDALPADLAPLIGGFLPWVLAFCVGISSTTAPSVSLEGSSRWLMLTAPVSTRCVLGAKAALNLAFALPTVVVGGTLLSAAFSLDAASVVVMFVVPLAFSLFSTCAGLMLDARHPRYDWTTVYEPVKRGMPVFVGIFGGMILTGLGIAATAFGGMAASLLFALGVGVVSVIFWRGAVGQRLVA